MRHHIERLWARLREADRAFSRQYMAGHWFGHNSRRILIGATVAVAASEGAKTWVEVPNAVSLVLLGVFLFACSAVADHDMRPCDKRISEMPLGPSLMAERWARSLAAYHYARDHRLGYSGLVFGWGAAVFMSAFVLDLIPVWIAVPLAVTPNLLDSTVTARHSQVELWCPRCRRGRGDGKERPWVPDAGPALSLTR